MKILFFSMHADIWVQAFPEALVAESLKRAGHDIVYVGCNKSFSDFCVPMAAHGMSVHTAREIRDEVCTHCVGKDRRIRSAFGFAGPQLSDVIDDDMRCEIDRILANPDRGALEQLTVDGVAIGRIALYQLMLRRKRLETDLSDDEFEEYIVELRNALVALYAGRRLLDQHRPDAVVVLNALYSVNRAVCLLAAGRGVPHYFMHAGGNLSNRLQTLWIGRGDTFSFFPYLVRKWPEFATQPCSGTDLASITEHFLELFRGQSVFVYSSPKSAQYSDVRARFGVGANQKLLVATLGSYDEERAAEIVGARVHTRKPLFETQIAWVQALVEHVKDRDDLFLLLRVHPREFPNKREGAMSHHARQLKSAFANLPANIAVNWPDQGVSMYDLADQADVFLNSWSSVGKEMALLGIPVVLYAPDLAFYPADLGYVGTTLTDYIAAIDRALADGWSFDRVRQAYRWYVFEFIRASLFIGDRYPRREGATRRFGQRLVDQFDRRIVPGTQQRWDCVRRNFAAGPDDQINQFFKADVTTLVDLLRPIEADRESLAHEQQALRREVCRLANALFPTREARSRSRLFKRLVGAEETSDAIAS